MSMIIFRSRDVLMISLLMTRDSGIKTMEARSGNKETTTKPKARKRVAN